MHGKLRWVGACLVALALGGGWVACSPASTSETVEASAPKGETEGPSDAARQRQTLADIRNVGTAMMAWVTDRMTAAAAGQATGQGTYDLSSLAVTPSTRMEELLVTTYIEEVPTEDGWGNPLEFRLAESVLAPQVFSIRSPGRDGEWDVAGQAYEAGPFDPTDYDRDIVLADGYLVRWPGRKP